MVSPTTGYNAVYSVTVNGISGYGGTLGLNFADNSGIIDQYGYQFTNPNGSLETQQTYAVGGWPMSAAVADLNGDGTLGLVVANCGRRHRQRADGQRGRNVPSPATYAVGSLPEAVAVADLSGDGKRTWSWPTTAATR